MTFSISRGRVPLAVAATVFAACTGVSLAQRPSPAVRATLIVLDASGSMTARLASGETRFDAARAAIVDMLQRLPVDSYVALRAYGHQSTPDKKDCDDTALIAGFEAAAVQKEALRAKLDGLKALGFTPISRTLERAVEDFKTVNAAGPRTVILVSDGRETCKADPCAVAAALAKANVELVVHTVGFGVDDAARRQLQCVARVARGTYFDAQNRNDLLARLDQAARQPPQATAPPSPPPKALPSAGTIRVAGLNQTHPTTAQNSDTGQDHVFTPLRDRLDVPPGFYTLHFINGPWPGIQVRAGETTEIAPAFFQVTKPAGVIILVDPETEEEVANFHAPSLPLAAMVPGRYRVRTLDGFAWPQLIELRAGQKFQLKSAVVRFRLDDLPPKDILTVLFASDAHSAEAVFDVNNQSIMLPAGRYTLSYPNAPNVAPITLDIAEDALVERDRPR